MNQSFHKTIHRALVSVYHKNGLDETFELLHSHGVELLSTGGTAQWIKSLGYPCTEVENLIQFPPILNGRVKTLHPVIFGGILGRRNNPTDRETLQKFDIPWIDLVIVDLYPFEETLKSGASEDDIIEKIDIGGISLIRAAAKNFQDVFVIPSQRDYATLNGILRRRNYTTLEERKYMAYKAFSESAAYDASIYNWFSRDQEFNGEVRIALSRSHPLRYGENPHQKGWFSGDWTECFDHIQGKGLSYNNLLDLDSGFDILNEFHDPAWVIIKHNNPCGVAMNSEAVHAFEKALASDTKSAFGGVFLTNRIVPKAVAEKLNDFFYEVISAPGFDSDALELLKTRGQRILLKHQNFKKPSFVLRNALNGFMIQERDQLPFRDEHLKVVTSRSPDNEKMADLKFAWKIVRHARTNSIVIAKGQVMIGIGVGHTSRVDALHHALHKCKEAGFDPRGSVMASEAFFPFSDSIEIAAQAGIEVIIQPGGSVRDNEIIESCNKLGLAMLFTGTRHFKH